LNTPPYCCFCGPSLAGHNPCVPGRSLQVLPHSCGHLSLMLLTAPHPLTPAYTPRHSIATRPPCMESTCHVLQAMGGGISKHDLLCFCSMLVLDPSKPSNLATLFWAAFAVTWRHPCYCLLRSALIQLHEHVHTHLRYTY
jgi:hypothetical protein